MTDDQKPQSDESDGTGNTGDANRRPVNKTYGVAAGIAAIAGFLGVYMSLPFGGNAPAPATENSTEIQAGKSAKAPTASTPKASGLKMYAKGHMGTFVVKKEPVPAPAKLKFTDYSKGDDDGAPVTIANWEGKIVLLNLWATWCAPCRKEMPDLLKLKQELGGADFDLVPVSIDRGGPAKPRKFLDQIKAGDLGLFQGPSTETSGPLKAFGMPTTVLFDRKGRELGRLVGPADWASDEAKALIKAAIAAE